MPFEGEKFEEMPTPPEEETEIEQREIESEEIEKVDEGIIEKLKEGSQVGELKEEIEEKEEREKETIERIQNFINSSFEEKFPFFDSEKEEYPEKEKEEYLRWLESNIKKQTEHLSSSQFREILGEDIENISSLITIKEEKGKELKEIKEEDISFLREEGGNEMLPVRFRILTNSLPEHLLHYISLKLEMSKKDVVEGTLSEEQLKERQLEKERNEKLLKLNREITKEIEKTIFPEKETKENLTFENFENFPYAGGKEFVEKAVLYLPEEVIGKNVRRIKYTEESKPTSEIYGIKGYTEASYDRKKKEIKFYRLPSQFEMDQSDFALNLAHEGGHALDPRIVPQEKLSIKEEIEMCKEFEMIRKKEIEFSPYVVLINHQDKKFESSLKSQESFAETISTFLVVPEYLRNVSPDKLKFCEKWLEKQFPEEGFTKTEKINEKEYYSRALNLLRKTRL